MSELDKIIDEGKVNQATAMVIFAVELKSQGEKIASLTQAINEDNKRYVTIKDHAAVEKRVGRLENAMLGVLTFVFLAVLTALVGLVIVK